MYWLYLAKNYTKWLDCRIISAWGNLKEKWGIFMKKFKLIFIEEYSRLEAESAATLKKFNDSNGGTYIVQPGDTLNKIAEMYGTTVGELVRLNGLSNPNMIVVGQEIVY